VRADAPDVLDAGGAAVALSVWVIGFVAAIEVDFVVVTAPADAAGSATSMPATIDAATATRTHPRHMPIPRSADPSADQWNRPSTRSSESG
jgi:hypothetical protein